MINSKMEQAMGRLGLSYPHFDKRLSRRLAQLASSELVEAGGCVFLQAQLSATFDFDAALAQSFDRTELECSLNEVSIADFLDEPAKREASGVLEQGMLYACAVAHKLAKAGSFTVILSFEALEITEASEYLSCTVRFHTDRPTEVSYVTPDLVGYEDALFVLKTDGAMDLVTLCP